MDMFQFVVGETREEMGRRETAVEVYDGDCGVEGGDHVDDEVVEEGKAAAGDGEFGAVVGAEPVEVCETSSGGFGGEGAAEGGEELASLRSVIYSSI